MNLHRIDPRLFFITVCTLGICSCATIDNTYNADLATNANTFQKSAAGLLVPIIRMKGSSAASYSSHVKTYDSLNVLIQQMKLDATVVQDTVNQENLGYLQTRLNNLAQRDQQSGLGGTYAQDQLDQINFIVANILISENAAKAVQEAQGTSTSTTAKPTPSN